MRDGTTEAVIFCPASWLNNGLQSLYPVEAKQTNPVQCARVRELYVSEETRSNANCEWNE